MNNTVKQGIWERVEDLLKYSERYLLIKNIDKMTEKSIPNGRNLPEYCLKHLLSAA